MSALTGQQGGQGDNASANAGNQTPPTDWRSALPAEYHSEKSLESIKGKDWAEAGPALVKSYVNAQKLVGADKLVLPTATSTPEQIKEFRTKLGVPEKFEDYGVKLPDGVKAEQLDQKLVDSWRQRLHAQGVPKAAAEALIADYITDNVGSAAAAEKARTDQDTQWELSLKQKFGDQYDAQVNYARHALANLGTPELAAAIDKAGFGNHPELVSFFAKAGKAISDDSANGRGNGQGNGAPKTAAAAQAALDAFNRDDAKQKALWDKSHASHEAVVKERAALFETAFPKEKAT